MAVTEIGLRHRTTTQTVEKILTTTIAEARLHEPPSRHTGRFVPCICVEGLVRRLNVLIVCPQCKGSRWVPIGHVQKWSTNEQSSQSS